MLFRPGDLDGIAEGRITLAFRRWERARVKPGRGCGPRSACSRSTASSRRAPDRRGRPRGGLRGRRRRAAAFKRKGDFYRIALHLAGPDPRVALRETPPDDAVFARLERWARGRTRSCAAIAEHPGLRAGDLAESFGRERLQFKRDVRKLKELGLTESLEIGYRLSPKAAKRSLKR